MTGIRRLLALLAIPALAASVAMAPAASAQDAFSPSPSPQPPKCSLLTVEEVGSAFAISDIQLSGGSGFYCSFTGGTYLFISVQPGKTLEQIKTENPGGVDLTVGDHPAWFIADSGSLWVDVGGQILSLSSSTATVTGDALQAALTTLAEAALPRVPAGPSAEDVARLQALIPDTIGGEAVTLQTYTGEMLLGVMDAGGPEIKVLADALASQGKTPADILVAAGNVESDSDAGILVVQFKGADASSLLLPFLTAFLPGATTAEVTTTEIGGKQVTVVAADPVISAYATGDLAVYANGPDDFLAGLFSSLP